LFQQHRRLHLIFHQDCVYWVGGFRLLWMQCSLLSCWTSWTFNPDEKMKLRKFNKIKLTNNWNSDVRCQQSVSSPTLIHSTL